MALSIVCLVDDAPDFRSLAAAIFKQYLPDYSLRLFGESQEFLNQLELIEPKPSLFILDQHMPSPNGYQTLVLLKQRADYRHIPVVMMSHDASPREIIDFFQAGTSYYSQKPLDLIALKDAFQLACQYAVPVKQ